MREYDLIILGAGSGNSILTPAFDNWKVAIVEPGAFGGTCLNRGCIPSKMFVYAADVIEQVRNARKLGLEISIEQIRWTDIVNRIFGRINPIATGGEQYRNGLSNVTVYKDPARFSGPKSLRVGDCELTGEHIVIATGATPFIPDISGLAETGFHTSDSIMHLDQVPSRLAILGGGYIATEMAHIFEAMGSEVTMIVRGPHLLSHEDKEVRIRFTEIFAERCNVLLGATTKSVRRSEDGQIAIQIRSAGGEVELLSSEILIATGRTPTTAALDLHKAGIECHNKLVQTDSKMRTNVAGVWAIGDVTNADQLKHTANAEARVVAHNIANPENLRNVDLWPTPHAVFSHPQVASVGATEQDLERDGISYVTGRHGYGETAYGWAMEDTTGFCKVLIDPNTRLLLGAHIIGPQSATLIHQLVQGMKLGHTVDELAHGFLYIHPALNEVVENALLSVI